MQYLDVLGVDSFVPRWVLPGAKPSSQLHLPVALNITEPVATPASPRADAAHQVQQVPVHVGTIIEELTGKSVSTDQSLASTEAPAATTITSTTTPVKFSLSIWRVSDRVLILDSRVPKEALPTQALLNNILAAKDWQLSVNKPEVLNWPMFASFDQGGGWPAASDMVLAFLQARLDHQPAKYLWVMGRDAYAAVVASVEDYVNRRGQLVENSELGSLIVVLPSLADMLKQPELKRLTWQAIRDLS